MGDQSYDAGDYPAAITAYSAYLRENPDSAEADRILFRLGMAHALPLNPFQDTAQAIHYMNQLTNRFPESSLRPQAELFVFLQQQLQNLHQDVAQRELQITGLSRELDQLSQQQVSEVEKLQGDLKSKEDQIRQLSEELERLKAIDMQRRPAAPSR